MNAQKHTSLSSTTSEQTFIAGDYSISISHAASHNSSLFSNVEPIEVFQTDYSAQTSPRLSLQNLAVSTDAEQEQPPHPLIAKINSVLVSALRKAMEAVTADHGGRFPFALQSYQECIVSLKQALNLKPLRLDNDDTDGINTSSKERQRILELVAVYSDRIQCLQSLVWEAQKIALMPDWQLEELPLSGNNCTAMNSNDQCRRNGQYELMRMEVAPKWLEHRVYWLLRQLRRSIMEGAPLTPNLYIPKEVWFLGNVKFTAIETKFDSLEMLVMWLQKVSSLDITDCPALCEELNTFTAVLDTLQNALARKLRFIKAADKSSGLMGSLAKQMERMHASYTRDKLEDVGEYLKLLVKLFENCQFLDGWLMHFSMLPTSSSTSAVLDRLARISEFLYDVICAFVMEDLRLLLDKYLKEMRKSFLAY